MASNYKVELKDIPFSRSPVSIIIPFHGQYQKVVELVTSILLFTRTNPYEILLINDGSNQSFIEAFKKTPQVRVFSTPRHNGFGAAVELGVSNSTQPWMLVLGSDCKVETSDWLLELGQSMLRLKDRGVKLVSARMSSADSYTDRLIAGAMDKGEDYIMSEEDGCLPFNCVLFHRELLEKIGFIKKYNLLGYEDEEFMYRMRHYGYKQAISGKSYVFHHGGATIKEILKKDPSLKNILEKNRDICIEDVRKLSYIK